MVQRLKQADIELNLLPYDCRLSMLSEVEYDTPPVLPDEWAKKQVKTKWTFKHEKWLLELTQIHSFGQRHNQMEEEAPLYELEFRFYDAIVESIKKKEREKLEAFAAQFWEFVTKLMSKLTSANDQKFFSDVKLQKVSILRVLFTR
jgi:hypothetical protein